MKELQKVELILTRDVAWDEEAVKGRDRSAFRRLQILRRTEQAYDQGAYLTQEDLARILGVSVRQIRRDLEVLREMRFRLYLSGVSHKVWLEWKTYSEIKTDHGHGVAAIKSYQHCAISRSW